MSRKQGNVWPVIWFWHHATFIAGWPWFLKPCSNTTTSHRNRMPADRRRSRLAGASARPPPLATRPVRPRLCGTRSCALPSEEFAALSLQQNDQQHRPECTGKHQNHLEGSCRTAGRTMYDIGGRRDGQRQNQERTRERLDVTKQTPINTNEICKIMAVFANSFVKLTPIQ